MNRTLMASQRNSTDSDERTPLIFRKAEDWTPPASFYWIETALWANVFLSGFDSTITASTYALISSEFNAANSASWLTTSYLITSTAFQPLYGRYSDIFGRRACFFVSAIAFALGCLGCSVAPNILLLNVMRALTGVGGGGLITMGLLTLYNIAGGWLINYTATIVNSDMIPFERRGMYQAAQNVLVGFGAVSGASLGGFIADSIGWRYCFALQVPVSLFALAVGYIALQNPRTDALLLGERLSFHKALTRVDTLGSALLVLALLVQLLGLSLGGNELPWNHVIIVGLLIGSFVLLGLFVIVEVNTVAVPVVPMKMLRGRLPISVQISNIFAGMAGYAFLFMLPLFFQIVLLDTPAKAGSRLIVPSLATPLGGLIAGCCMSRGGKLSRLVRFGTMFLTVGNLLVASFSFTNARWKYFAFLIPANLGLGMTNPSLLFSFVSAFEHREQAVATSLVYLIRSLGTIYGVTISSAIVQNVLVARLPRALEGIHHKDKASHLRVRSFLVVSNLIWKQVIEEIRRSIFALRGLSPDVQLLARHVYYEAIKIAFIASTVFATCAIAASFVASGRTLKRDDYSAKIAIIDQEQRADEV